MRYKNTNPLALFYRFFLGFTAGCSVAFGGLPTVFSATSARSFIYQVSTPELLSRQTAFSKLTPL
jgi:hypothetical protein